MAPAYPERLSLAHTPTPLQPLDRLSRELGGPRIWLKRDDLTGATLTGNKIRKLEFSLAQALAEGCDAVITCGGLQSNHCRATALLCAQLGLRCHLILRGKPDGPADGNLLLDQLAGASISYREPAEYRQRLPELFDETQQWYARQGLRAFAIPTGASDGIGVWGYVAASEELGRDFAAQGISPAHILCATGSGGTQAGLVAGNQLFDLGAQVWGVNVCDDEAWFQRKVREDLVDWNTRYSLQLPVEDWPIGVIDGYVGPGYGRADRAVFDTIRRLAEREGVVLDPVYTGKAMRGLIDQLRQGRFRGADDIVFIHTGGVFGLFPQRLELAL
ncbi:MAG TPA: D-cysteine desulfhydrase family protein [Spongiibacteraceae bacterium]|jgi:D-cysteine desulfhydrase|nr:D-cysteine desulfhydrase family protein [Spongiibacteraceae bacterium]HUH36940.1 D-cysteine desulfhydrase family protein [Spongiibacteraceae bacterium]